MIDKNSHIPMYIQISNYILEFIEKNKLKEGDLIASETKMSKEFGVSRMTVKQAVDQLVANGYLEKQRGKGTFVKKQDIDRIELPLNVFRNFSKELRKLGKTPNNRVIVVETKKANEKIAKLLEIEAGTDVIYCERLRCLDNTPVILEQSYMLYEYFKDVDAEVLKGSKFDYIQDRGHVIKESYREIAAEIPTPYVAELLKLTKNEPVLKAKSCSYLTTDKVFEYSEVSYNQRKYKFTLRAKFDYDYE